MRRALQVFGRAFDIFTARDLQDFEPKSWFECKRGAFTVRGSKLGLPAAFTQRHVNSMSADRQRRVLHQPVNYVMVECAQLGETVSVHLQGTYHLANAWSLA